VATQWVPHHGGLAQAMRDSSASRTQGLLASESLEVELSNPPPADGRLAFQARSGRREKSRPRWLQPLVRWRRGGHSSVRSGVQPALFAKGAGRGLTLRSSRPAPARRPGRPEPSAMLLWSARAPCLHGRLSSNVRRHGSAVAANVPLLRQASVDAMIWVRRRLTMRPS
jgi:hypothetical protein